MEIPIRHMKDLGALHEYGHVAWPRSESDLNYQGLLVGHL